MLLKFQWVASGGVVCSVIRTTLLILFAESGRRVASLSRPLPPWPYSGVAGAAP
jgi:hypothetical protein